MTPSGAGPEERRSLSIRRLLAFLLAALGVLVACLFLVTSLQLRGSNSQTRAENRRNESFRLADTMRQSSDDLTLMVRLYVSTGLTRYRDHYNEILAIRSGTAPRPLDYDSSFWDRVLAEGKGFVRYGAPRSLTDQMRAADFTKEEFDALEASLAASNDLARLELEIMDRVAARIARGVDAAYFADVNSDYQRLVDNRYLAEKGVIMEAVDDFVDLVDERTLADVERARSDNRKLFAAQLGVLGLIVLISLASLAVLTRVVLRPLDGLIAATRRIADGDYQERAEVRSVSELERLAGAFNEMATAIQSDVAARQVAEQSAVEARRAAEEASGAKSTFLAAMSHEIRTPMIGVTGMLEVLARSGLDPQQRHMVGIAQSSASSLIQIIGGILDFSKIEAGKLEIVPCTFAVRPLTDAAAATFFHTASAKGLLVTWTVDDRLAPAHVGDALRVRQILTNFLSNAVKFTDVGGVQVSVRMLEESPDRQTVEFAVTDTGPGLSPEQQRRLFEEFNQASTTDRERSAGTGLGLVICKRLAQLMDGDVSMASTLGQGTTMRFTVPLGIGDPADVDGNATALKDREVLSRPKPTRAEADREGSVVLLAEDHPVNRTVLCHQLDIIGFHVDTAPDGQVGFEMFKTGRYGLVLTDLNMPGLDGYELTAAIRGHEEAGGAERTPILALSANVMQGEPEKCLAAGMDDFVAKPTTIPFLGRKLRQWLPHLTWPSDPVPADWDAGGRALDGEATEAAIDAGVLDELTGGDPAVAASVLQDFVEASRADVAALEAAVTGGDIDEVRRQAHRVKGASRIVGARRLALLAEQLEFLADDGRRHGDPAEIRRVTDDLVAALGTVESAVSV